MRGLWGGARVGLLAAALVALLSPLAAFGADDVIAPVLRLTKMTFLASQGSSPQLLLEAERAEIPSGSEIAYLRDVHGKVTGETGTEGGLVMTCDRAEYHIDTGDFVAQGNVRGRTGDGRRFETSRLRYDSAKALAMTDVPVTIEDRHGRYQGGGFLYHVGEGRFQLTGGASVIQQ